MLEGFAKLDVKTSHRCSRRPGSQFLAQHESGIPKKDDAQMDWMFIVWQPASWERLHATAGSQSDWFA